MNEDRWALAEVALREVPEHYRAIDAAELVARDRGHHFHHGMHLAWVWGQDRRGVFLDFLDEHRLAGMEARRFYADGSREGIATPAEMYSVTGDPETDADTERNFLKQNQAIYSDLRDRGLLPPRGGNVGSQDINEYLHRSGPPTGGSGYGKVATDGDPHPAGADRKLLGGGWDEELCDEFDKAYWRDLHAFVAGERAQSEVFPAPSKTFAAFAKTPFDDLKVVILGQDPYHRPGQAQGLAFSVPADLRPKPPSVRKIHAALQADLEIEPPEHGNLEGWAQQGVLLLNTTLTVRCGEPMSHEGKGWERFTDAVIQEVSHRPEPVVFLLWGQPASSKQNLISEQHLVISAAHPQARATAHNPLIASSAFSQANTFLGKTREIDWGQFEATV